VKAHSIASRILLVLVATMMLALSATLAWAAVTDYQTRGLVPKGVSVAGQDLSGMTEAHARQAIIDAVSTPLMRPITVTGDNRSWTLDPKGIVSVDVESMLDEAYSPRRSATFVTRVTHRLSDEPLPADIKPKYSVDTNAVTAWVAQTSNQINRVPVNATRKLGKKYKLKITPEVLGAKVVQNRAVEMIGNALQADTALSNQNRVVALPIYNTKPKIMASSFKMAIVVSLSRCKVYLYKGDKLVKKYSCAPGQPAWPTPTGDFVVDSKMANAPWYNPHSAWSASMPEVIAGGPYNPMGDRKIGINYAGVFLHGVPPSEYSSIGTHASHGCMRMLPSSIHDLYPRVKLGDPVYIRD
jgi:lipoprotein-anchoring transpeptidase ErfK/SrfK